MPWSIREQITSLALLLIILLTFQNCGKFDSQSSVSFSSSIHDELQAENPKPNPWEKEFLKHSEIEHKTKYDPWSKDPNSFWHYYVAYGVDGYLAMFEATQNKAYLDRALLYLTQIKDTARKQSDGYMGWRAVVPGGGTTYEEGTPLYESFLWRYGARVLNVIRKDPELFNDPIYREKYDDLLPFLETHLFEKWYSRDVKWIYRLRTHMASHWASIALYLSEISTSEEMQELYAEVLYKFNYDFPQTGMTGGMKQQVKPHPEDAQAYFWNGIWGSSELPGNDISHGNAEIQFMIESFVRGEDWTEADILALRYLVKNALWNQSLTNPEFAEYLDGEGSISHAFISDGVLKLGRFDSDLQKIFEAYKGQNMYLTQYYGNLALNAALLSTPLPVAP